MKKITLIFLFLSGLNFTEATIRYVSKTGSSTPPYLTWETASDSIQKCINICFDGDTVIVANGVYKENLIVNKYLWLIGSSMDSTVIDGTGLFNYTVDFKKNAYLKSFMVKGTGAGTENTCCIHALATNAWVANCRLINAYTGIGLVWSSSVITNCIITNIIMGFATNVSDTSHPTIKSSIIFSETHKAQGIRIEGGEITVLENIIIGPRGYHWLGGIDIGFPPTVNIIKNNIVWGYTYGIDALGTDTAVCENNTSLYASEYGIAVRPHTRNRNNIFGNNALGIAIIDSTTSDYNLYWKNDVNSNYGILGEHDIIADPMFVNDTVPVYGGTYDFHLQKYSPAIDAGDPDILDIDGSRSDIGAYGGPGGIKYTYKDLAPKPPVNLSAEYDTVDIKVKWNKNTEADLAYYRIYRDTVAGFPADSTTLILSLTDTSYTHQILPGTKRLFYKITAVDSQGNESYTSEELAVVISSAEGYPVLVNEYMLYQNYPNPFNPSTTIGYRLKERGYVMIMVYDIKGEMIKVLVNEEKDEGYYETEFNAENLASGIYLYRIEIIGVGNIPVYSEMKKLLLIK